MGAILNKKTKKDTNSNNKHNKNKTPTTKRTTPYTMDAIYQKQRQEELRQHKKDKRRAENTKARKKACTILPEEKKEDISEIKKYNYEEKTV